MLTLTRLKQSLAISMPLSKSLLCAISVVIFSSQANASGAPGGFEESLKLAIKNDLGLKKALYQYQATQQEDDISFSNLLPSITFNALYQYENSDNIYTDEGSTSFNPDLERSGGELDDYYWRVNLRQPLFDYSSYKGYQRDKAFVEAAKFRYERAEQELVYRVAQQYLSVLFASQSVYLNQDKLQALELKLKQETRTQELGVGNRLNVLRATSSRDLARSELLASQSELKDAKTLLRNITGDDIKIQPSWIENGHKLNPILLAGNESEWITTIHNNANIKEAKSNIQKQEYGVSAREAQHLPTLSFNLSYLDRTSEDDFRTREDFIASVEFSMPLYSGGRISANVKKAESELLASQVDLDYLLSEKTQLVQLSYNRLISFKDRLNALIESEVSSRTLLEAAERQQALNLGSQIEVLEARTQLVDIQIQFAKTLNDYLLADLNLRLETGQLNQSRLETYDRLFTEAATED